MHVNEKMSAPNPAAVVALKRYRAPYLTEWRRDQGANGGRFSGR